MLLLAALALAGEPTRPVPLSSPELSWPVDADPTGPLGVDLDVTINPSGETVRIVVRHGQPALAAAALAALSDLRFSPATEDGVPVEVELTIHLDFLPPPGAAPPAVPAVTAPSPVTPPSPAARGIVGRYTEPVSGGSSVSAEDIRRFPGTLGDPVRAVLGLPGTVRAPLEAGMLLVRGANPRDSEVYIDGAPVASWAHLGGFASIVHPAWFKEVNFWPSGAPARYGRVTAGVVDVVTKGPETSRAGGGASLVFTDAFGWYRGDEGGVGAAFRRSYLDGVLNLAPGLPEGASSVAPRFADAQLRLERHDSHLFVLGAQDQISGSTPEGTLAQFTTQNLYVLGGTTLRPGSATLELQPALAYERYDASLADAAYTNPQTGLEAALRSELSGPGDGQLSLRGGLDLAARRSRAQYATRSRALWITSPQVWSSLKWGDKRWLRADLRLEPWFVEHQLPRVGLAPELAWSIPLFSPDQVGYPALTVHGDVGASHQLPPEELLVPAPEGSSLLLERAGAAALGLRLESHAYHIDLSGYGRRMDRVSGYEPDGSVGQGDGGAYGLELSGRAEVGRWVTQQSLGLGRSWRRDDPDALWFPSPVDQPVSWVGIAAVELGRGFCLSTRLRYATGLPLPEDWSLTLHDALTGRTEVLANDPRLPPFHSLDLKLSREKQRRNLRTTGYLDVQNVYNRRVPEPLVDGALGQSSIYAFGLPILPIFGLELHWTAPAKPAPDAR